jgi:YjzC-like protein
MKKPSGLKPGQAVPMSGIYQEVGPRGGLVTQVTSVQGEPFPPTANKGGTYTLVTPAKHK